MSDWESCQLFELTWICCV